MSRGLFEHLINIEDLDKSVITDIIRDADLFKQNRKKSDVTGKTVALMFCENSTRTRCSFEEAAKKLGMNVINFDATSSSFAKGESMKDTVENLYAIGVEVVVIRHSITGIIDNTLGKINCNMHFVNAGDGNRAHPSQALLDFYTMLETLGTVEGKKVLIAGDISFSRVAKSNIALLNKFGADVHLCSPKYYKPSGIEKLGVTYHDDIEDALKDADVVMVLRVQNERHGNLIYPSTTEYKRKYNINSKNFKLAKESAILMHPGPVNRDVELSSELMDSDAGKTILRQTKNGVFVRMAILNKILSSGRAE